MKKSAENVISKKPSTELPEEYLFYKEKSNCIKTVYENILKAVIIVLQSNDSSPDVKEKVNGLFNKITTSVGINKGNEYIEKRTIFHDLSNTFLKASELISKCDIEEEEVTYNNFSLTTTLNKYGQAIDVIGDHRIKMNGAIIAKFITPLTEELDNSFLSVHKAKKNVEKKRSCLDSYKNNQSENKKVEIEKAEEDFIQAVNDAITEMTSFVQNTRIHSCLNDLIEIQKEYYKKTYETLNEIVLN